MLDQEAVIAAERELADARRAVDEAAAGPETLTPARARELERRLEGAHDRLAEAKAAARAVSRT